MPTGYFRRRSSLFAWPIRNQSKSHIRSVFVLKDRIVTVTSSAGAFIIFIAIQWIISCQGWEKKLQPIVADGIEFGNTLWHEMFEAYRPTWSLSNAPTIWLLDDDSPTWNRWSSKRDVCDFRIFSEAFVICQDAWCVGCQPSAQLWTHLNQIIHNRWYYNL